MQINGQIVVTRPVFGKALKAGDMLAVLGKRARIIALTPYRGPLAHLFKEGAQIAAFDCKAPSSMTINNGELYEVVL